MGRVIQALLMKDAARRRNFRPFRVFKPRLPWATAKTVLKPTEKPITAKPRTKPTAKATTKPTANTIVVKPVTKRMPDKKRMPVDEAHGEAHDEETTADTKILKPTAKPVFPRPPSHPPPKAMVNDYVKARMAEVIATAGTPGFRERVEDMRHRVIATAGTPAAKKALAKPTKAKFEAKAKELKAKRWAEFEAKKKAEELKAKPTTDATESLALWSKCILQWK